MKMKKYLSIAILLMLMATPLVFTSCGGDDLVEGIENQEPTTEIWIEPYHIKGASVEDVKSYMASRMSHFTMTEQVSAGCVQLVYSDKRRHYKIFCVNGNTGFRNESRIFYFIHLQNEEAYERKESSSA